MHKVNSTYFNEIIMIISKIVMTTSTATITPTAIPTPLLLLLVLVLPSAAGAVIDMSTVKYVLMWQLNESDQKSENNYQNINKYDKI